MNATENRRMDGYNTKPDKQINEKLKGSVVMTTRLYSDIYKLATVFVCIHSWPHLLYQPE